MPKVFLNFRVPGGQRISAVDNFNTLPLFPFKTGGDATGIINPDVYQMTMNKDEIEGKGKKIKGQIREEVGKLTDNKTEQLKGKIEQVEGDIQQGIGKIKKELKD